MTMDILLHALKALAEETRLRLFNILLQHELNVGELTVILGMGQSRVSRHLKILVESGLLAGRRDGLWVFYSAVASGFGQEVRAAVEPLIRVQEDSVLSDDLARADAVMEERNQATQRFFDSIATDWDSLSNQVLGGLDLNAEIASRLPQGGVVADLGCGTGRLLAVMAKGADQVVGVDNSQKMLDVARKSFAHKDNAVSLRIGELEHLPLRDKEADAAVMSMALHHLSNPMAGIAEAYRVLSDSGTFILVDFLKHDTESMRFTYGDRWLGFSAGELDDWLENAGFKPGTSQDFSVNKGLTVRMVTALK